MIKAPIMRGLRSVRNAVSKAGLDIRTVRGRDHWRAGLEVIWHKFDDRTERARICHVDSFGPDVQFLVRSQADYIQSHFLTGHFYSEPELKLIQQHYRGGAFLDVGANVGNHSVFAAKVLDAPRVIAVEPNPEAWRILRCNLILNDLEGQVDHWPIALSDHAGAGRIESMEGNLGLGTLQEGGDVPIKVGDDLLGDVEVGFLKLDIEGHEMPALRGLEKTIARCRPTTIVEVADEHADEFRKFWEALDYRVGHAFRVYHSNAYFLMIPNEVR